MNVLSRAADEAGRWHDDSPISEPSLADHEAMVERVIGVKDVMRVKIQSVSQSIAC